jgi:uncharacterized protein
MKPLHSSAFYVACVLCALTWLPSPRTEAAQSSGKIRALVVYGGHDFETNQFFRVFQDNPELTFTAVEYPKAQAFFRPDEAKKYDLLVFYDMWQNISEEAKSDLVSMVKGGKPLVALHHTLGSFQKWDEYANIIGGRYHLEPWTLNGKKMPGSTYKHDVDFKVQVADPEHPVTRGLKDFYIHDETYGGVEVKPDSHVLLTTDEPTSTRAVAWAKSYGKARVVCIQLGHDHKAYENPNYRQLMAQAIRWVAAGNGQSSQ